MINNETTAQQADTTEHINDPMEGHHAPPWEHTASVVVLTIPFVRPDTPANDQIDALADLPISCGGYFWANIGFIIGCHRRNLGRLVWQTIRTAITARRLFIIFPVPWGDLAA